MASNGFDHSLLCPLSSLSCSGKFKFPAKTPPSTVEFCARTSNSKSSTVATTAAAEDSSKRSLFWFLQYRDWPPRKSKKMNIYIYSLIFFNLFSATKRVINNDQPCFGVSYGRRELIVIATLPFILPVHESMQKVGVEAAELGTSEYLLMKEEIRKVLSKGKAAGVLRLVFHDAGTFEVDDNSGGMNGSIVYELERPENTGLKKSLKILEKAKSGVDMVRPVSWADLIAVAGAEAVLLCGGPKIPVHLGRLDTMAPDPEGKLPEESLDASSLKQCFQRKGLSTQDLVALSGAHTIGGKGFGNPTVFDNSYFKILLEKPWKSSDGMSSMIGLPSDRALVEDDECLRWITKYANDQNTFFEDFKNAYIKLVNSGARWKN